MSGLVLLHANILVGDSLKEDFGLIIRNGKIVFVGPSAEVLRRIDAGDKVIDLNGKVVLPGLCDAHIHLLGLAIAHMMLDLRNVPSIKVLKDLVRRKAEELGPGKWILGRGWDQEIFAEKRYPNRWDLDEVSPRNPVFLVRVCGHIAVANTLALKIAGIDKLTKDPPDGVIERADDGEPTGILREGALSLVRKVIPQPSMDDIERALEGVLQELLKVGLTTVHAVSVTREELTALQRLREKGKLRLKVRVYLERGLLNDLKRLQTSVNADDRVLRISGVKILVDGSLGGRTAALMDAYSDDPGNKGELLMSRNELIDIFKLAKNLGIQVAVHAIGDRALKEVLDAMEISGIQGDLIRIEHASLISPVLLKRLRRLMPHIVVQPHFIITDWWIVRRLGEERARWTYAFKTLLKSGLNVAASSDAPVEPHNPWESIYAAITRGKYEGRELFKYTYMECLSLLDAIKMYTENAARITGENAGIIEVGRDADLVVIDAHTLEMNERNIRGVRILAAIVNGEVVYQEENFKGR